LCWGGSPVLCRELISATLFAPPIIEPVVVDPKRFQMSCHLHNSWQQIDGSDLSHLADRVALLHRKSLIELLMEFNKKAIPGVARP
jgi:hypothetical protein